MRSHDNDVEDLLWCLRPIIDLHATRPEAAARLARKRRIHRVTRLTEPRGYRSFLLHTTTLNQERALERVVGTSAKRIPLGSMRLKERDRLLAAPAVREARRAIVHTLRGRVSRRVLADYDVQLNAVARGLHLYRRHDLSQYSGVLLATQHDPLVRALMLVAREQSVPTIYVPHAPVARSNSYHDLPVTYAGLRGKAERGYYASALDLDPKQLDVVGNLASDMLYGPMPEIRPDAVGVLAVSPHPAPVLQKLFAAVDHPGLDRMVVAPHPRSDLDELRRLMPSHWQLHQGGRTLGLLEQGPAFLLQLSSGVAWESAALGIPTATVQLDDAPAPYPLLDDESIYPKVSGPQQVLDFAVAARRGEIDRAALKAHALEWCAADGEEAAIRLRTLLGRITGDAEPPRHARLHDGWGSGGVALNGSMIRGTEAAPTP